MGSNGRRKLRRVGGRTRGATRLAPRHLACLRVNCESSGFKNNYFAKLWSGSVEGSCLRLIDLYITQFLGSRVIKNRNEERLKLMMQIRGLCSPLAHSAGQCPFNLATASKRRGNNSTMRQGLIPASQGNNLVLTALSVPDSLDSGQVQILQMLGNAVVLPTGAPRP